MTDPTNRLPYTAEEPSAFDMAEASFHALTQQMHIVALEVALNDALKHASDQWAALQKVRRLAEVMVKHGDGERRADGEALLRFCAEVETNPKGDDNDE